MKVRKSKQGFMGSASRVETPRKGKGSFSRKEKHKKTVDGNTEKE